MKTPSCGQNKLCSAPSCGQVDRMSTLSYFTSNTWLWERACTLVKTLYSSPVAFNSCWFCFLFIRSVLSLHFWLFDVVWSLLSKCFMSPLCMFYVVFNVCLLFVSHLSVNSVQTLKSLCSGPFSSSLKYMDLCTWLSCFWVLSTITLSSP